MRQHKQHLIYRTTIALLSVGVLMSSTAVTSFAAPPVSDGPSQISPDVYVVGSLSAPVANPVDGSSKFTPLPAGAENALIVMPDVAKDLGVTTPGFVTGVAKKALFTKMDSLALSLTDSKVTNGNGALSPNAVASPTLVGKRAPFWGPSCCGYGPTYRGPIAMAISQGGKNYAWEMNLGSQTKACGLAWGAYRGYNGSSFGLWEKWYGLGCVGGGHVPWDNVLAYPAVPSYINDVAPG